MKLAVGQFKEVIVYARKFWNDTGIDVADEEEYIFEASGKWIDLIGRKSPDGYSNFYMSLFNKFKRFKNAQWFVLIGSIDKTGDFSIGKGITTSVKQDGRIYCYANDVPGFYWNNFGHITVKITRKK